MKRRRQIWEALGWDKVEATEVARKPEDPDPDLEVGKLFPLQVGKHGGARPHPKEFAADLADKTGRSKSSINQELARADALGSDLQAVAGTSLDKGVELDALAKLKPAERASLIERARKGEQVSARSKRVPATA